MSAQVAAMPSLDGLAGPTSQHCLPAAKPTATGISFETLVREIRAYLGTSAGLDDHAIDVEHLKALMARYTSDPRDWRRFARGDASKNYTRNLIDTINGKANLLILVWNPGKGSPVHDHADAHCVMKILHGTLRETVYETPAAGTDVSDESPLAVKRDTRYHRDGVTYICDQIGLHRVVNPTEEVAVSLHLYTPPNAADFGYNIFDEATGRSSHVKSACSDFQHTM